MKTYSYSGKRLSIYSLYGLALVLFASCGSYQNSSYYDGDGVYGNSQTHRREVTNKDNAHSDKYQEYFSNLNKDPQVFTNVDQYSSTNNDSIKRTDNYNQNNASWGDNPQNVSVNVYDNNWGYGYWNNYWYGNYWGYNSWYGPGYSWGWNNWYGPSWNLGWGLGWNNWYGGYGLYGYNHWYGNYYNNYYYSGGRRGGAYGYASNEIGRTGHARSVVYNNNVNGGSRGTTYSSNTRTRYTFANGTRSSYGYPPRNTANYNQTRNTQSTRSYNTRTESAGRSYSPSSGGSRSSSYGGGGGFGGGGGRSSGGGGGRR